MSHVSRGKVALCVGAYTVAMGFEQRATAQSPSPCPTQLVVTAGMPGGTCGRINDAANGTGTNLTPFGATQPVLECGSLYVGGGASVQSPSPIPDGATTIFNVSDCSDPTALVLAPASAADTGDTTRCSEASCFFGPPLPMPNPAAVAVSTCWINRIANTPPVGGMLDGTTGEAEITLPLTVSVFVTGDLNGAAPGIQPCPLCVAGLCDLGPNAGESCTTTSSAGTTNDCPPPGTPLPSFGVDLSPLVTGTVQRTSAAGNFCGPTPGQATLGCFGTGLGSCKYVEVRGAPAGDLLAGGPLDATLAAVLCVPASGSPLVDTVANLPGPAAETLRVDLRLLAPTCASDAACDDGTVCDGIETCVDNLCRLGVPLNCKDADPCTTDVCHPVSGCTNTSIPDCPFVLTSSARRCQSALAAGAGELADQLHQQMAACLDAILRDVAAGRGTLVAGATCRSALDPADSRSAFSRARALAEKNIQQRCGGVTPADINSPCDETSPTMADVIQCVLDEHVDGVEQGIKALYRDACTLLDAVGLAGAFPGVC